MSEHKQITDSIKSEHNPNTRFICFWVDLNISRFEFLVIHNLFPTKSSYLIYFSYLFELIKKWRIIWNVFKG